MSVHIVGNRQGESSPIGQLFSLDTFTENAEVAKIFGLLFSAIKLCIKI
jgi:hypothetical protein